MIKADLFIEAEATMAEFQKAFTIALGLEHGIVTVIMGGDDYPELGTCDAFVEIWPISGDCRTRASVFLVSGKATKADPDDEMLGQSLADRLGCGVCIAVDDPDPWKFMSYRPEAKPCFVTLDLDKFDEEESLTVRPYRNVWAGPVTS